MTVARAASRADQTPRAIATINRGKRFRKIDYERAFRIPRDKMSDTFPDRLSVNPKSPYYDEKLLERGVGIKFNGAEKTNVEEYCLSEGWIKVVAGKSLDRHGNPMTIKLKGAVEPYFHKPAADMENP
jgi:hypothetical protein